MTKNRVPPGQVLTHKWPVLDLGERPAVDHRDFSLTVAGLAANHIRWSWDHFMAQPQVSLTTDIHCVTNWSRLDNRWEGVSAKQFLSVVQPYPDAKFMIFRSHDGYATNIPLADFDREDVLLAHSWEGEPISREHGGPVRPIIPHLYFWKSAKWLRHILFTDKDVPGYWEVRGYHMRGDPWKEERYE